MWQTKIFSLELFNWERKGITTGGGVNWAPFSMFLKIKISWLNPVLFPWGDNLSCHNAAFKSTELHIWMVKTGKKIWTWRSSSHHSFCFNPSLQFPISNPFIQRNMSVYFNLSLVASLSKLPQAQCTARQKRTLSALGKPPPLKRVKSGQLSPDYRQMCKNATRDILMTKVRKIWWQRCVKWPFLGMNYYFSLSFGDHL